MSDLPQDSELRARFHAQRRADAQQAPSFARMIARAHAAAADAGPSPAPGAVTRRVGQRRLLYAGGLAAAAVIATVLIIPRQRSNEDAFEQAVRAFQTDPALGAWRSPTDGLLHVPGLQLMSTVPSVGAR